MNLTYEFQQFMITLLITNNIEMFKIFQTGNGKKFLNKTKDTKNKRQEEIKKNQAIIVLQKNIRAYITTLRHANSDYPLLIKNLQKKSNVLFVEQFWQNPNNSPAILRNHFVRLTISSLMRQIPLKVASQNFINQIIEYKDINKDLSIEEYEFVIDNFLLKMNGPTLASITKRHNFKKALSNKCSTNFHKLTDTISQLQDFSIANELICSFQQHEKSKNKMDIEQVQNEERILKSYYKIVQIYHQIREQKGDEDKVIFLLSMAVDKMKRYYTNLILHKYNIDVHVFRSPDLQDEVEEIFKQKREWEQYSFHLYHISNMMEHILAKFFTISSDSIANCLNIIIEVTKLTGNFINIKISKDEFLNLVQKLDNRPYLNRQQQSIKNYQLLFTIITLQKYLQNLNDLQFIKIFQYDLHRLQKLIKNCLVRFMKSLANFNTHEDIVRQILKHSISWMNNLYNKIFRTKLLKTSIFEDPSFTVFEGNYGFSQYGNKKYIKELMTIVERSPYLLPIQTRFLMFKKIVRDDRNDYGYHGQEHISIKRGRQFQNAFDQLHKKNLKNSLRIRFINDYGLEQGGIDAGGLTKQFLNRVIRKAFDPHFGMFIQNGKKELMPNPEYEKIQDGRKAQQYIFIGKLLGKSLYQNIMLGIKFAGPFLNLLLNKKNTFDDLLQVDPDLYKSLAYIVAMEEEVESLELTFQYQDNLNKKIINLLPGGAKIKVHQKNKMEYINLLINYKVNRSFQRQTRYIRKGLRSIIHQSWIEMFNYAEFNYLLSGTGTIDMRDWINHTNFHGGDNELIKQFWEIVCEFTQEEKSLLLKFVTSCERPSFLGFKDLQPPFTIRIIENQKDKLPVSHTCSNVLDLPHYSSKQLMKEKILYAIKSGAGFQMA